MSSYLKEINIEGATRDSFPYSLDLFKNGLRIDFEKNVTFIVGDNGTGKSTLLENIAHKIGFNIFGGNRNHMYAIPIDDNTLLSDDMRMVWNKKTSFGFFMRAESFLNFAAYIDTLDDGNSPYGGKSLNKQSHGEAFLSLFTHKFDKGIFILDEPEAALSPQRQLALLRIINDLTKDNKSQFIIATHSPILMAYPDADLLLIEDGELKKENYKNTTHFQITKRFLDNPENFFDKLFGDGEG